MTVNVRMISGTTIRIKCDKKQEADTVSKKENRMRTAIRRRTTYLTHQGKKLNDKKTVEATIEMSRSLQGGIEKTT